MTISQNFFKVNSGHGTTSGEEAGRGWVFSFIPNDVASGLSLSLSLSLSLDSLGRFNIPELTYLLILHYMQLPEKQKNWTEKQTDCVLSVADRTRDKSRRETPAFTS